MVNGVATKARFNEPCALALWRSTLLVADRANNAIRVVNLTSSAVSLLAGSCPHVRPMHVFTKPPLLRESLLVLAVSLYHPV